MRAEASGTVGSCRLPDGMVIEDWAEFCANNSYADVRHQPLPGGCLPPTARAAPPPEDICFRIEGIRGFLTFSCQDREAVQGGIPMTARVEGAASPPPI
jgi:hypothetical protein